MSESQTVLFVPFYKATRKEGDRIWNPMAGMRYRAAVETRPALPAPDAAPGIEHGAVAAPLIATVLGAAVFGAILTRGFTTWESFGDFAVHNERASHLADGGRLEMPHPLYHLLVIVLHALLPHVGFGTAGLWVALATQSLLVLTVYAALRSGFGLGARPSPLAAAAMALPLCLVAPVYLLTRARRQRYFGYVYPNTFHSPTMILLRPFALGLFVACAAVLSDRRAPAALLAALTLACGLAKPNYLICLFPALVLLAIADRRPGARERWRALTLYVIVPGAALLALQAWFTLATDRMRPSELAWAPLAVIRNYVPDSWPLIAAKLALSSLFPLSVLLAFPGELRREPGLRLAWLAFAIGVVYSYGFAELGPRLGEGNFLWCGQVTLFVLFVASARTLLGRTAAGPRDALRIAACAVVFLAQLASGLAYAWRVGWAGRPV